MLDTWDTEAPCRDHPGFEQPGEDENWHLTENAATARELCTTFCAFRIPCATRALTSGTTTDDQGRPTPAPADGVIAAGIVCRGDGTTRRRLEAIAGITAGHHLATVTDITAGIRTTCKQCSRRFAKKGDKRKGGEVRLGGRGMCEACYKAARRAGNAEPTTAPRPEWCLRCAAPMLTRSQAMLPGHVVHEARGNCAACERHLRSHPDERQAA